MYLYVACGVYALLSLGPKTIDDHAVTTKKREVAGKRSHSMAAHMAWNFLG